VSAESVNCGKKNEINQNVTVRRRAVSRDSSTSALRDSGVTKHMFWDVIISGGSAVGPRLSLLIFFSFSSRFATLLLEVWLEVSLG
jgi:hypothetical protein